MANEQHTQLSDGSVDPNVRIPDHVKQGAASADALHEQFYPKDLTQAPAPLKEAVPQPAQPDAAAVEQARIDAEAVAKAAAQASDLEPQAHTPADNEMSSTPN
jgi:hypothetical protein